MLVTAKCQADQDRNDQQHKRKLQQQPGNNRDCQRLLDCRALVSAESQRHQCQIAASVVMVMCRSRLRLAARGARLGSMCAANSVYPETWKSAISVPVPMISHCCQQGAPQRNNQPSGWRKTR